MNDKRDLNFQGKVVAKPFIVTASPIIATGFLLLTVCFHTLSKHRNHILFHFRHIFCLSTRRMYR